MRIKWIGCSDAELEEVKKIRRAVFTEEQGIPVQEDIDSYDTDPATCYVLLFDGGKAVATGRLIENDNGFKIGRIAVLKEYRGGGRGAALVNALCEKAVTLGADAIHVEAQLHAVPFYEKLGFCAVSDDIILDRGIEHLAMRKDVL